MDILDNINHHGNQITNSYLQGTAQNVSNPLTIRVKNQSKGAFDGGKVVNINLNPIDFGLPDSFQWDDGTPITPNENNVLVIKTIRGYQGLQGLQGTRGLQGIQGFKGVLNEAVYNNPIEMPADLGGLPKGTTFNNVNYVELLDRLLYPYVSPKISLTSSLASKYVEIGDTISTINLTAKIVKGLNDLNKLEFLVNNNVVKTINSPQLSVNHTLSNVKATSVVSARIVDKISNGKGGTEVISNEFNYTFVRPIYIGLTNILPTADNLSQVISQNTISKRIVQVGSTQSYISGSFDRLRYVIIVPSSNWTLKKVTDLNGFDNTAMFINNKLTGNLTALDGNLVNFNIYFSEVTSKSASFTMNYEFN